MSSPKPDDSHFLNGNPLNGPFPENMQVAIFGMGCFWGVERMFWGISGVWVTSVGYTAGVTEDPTYQKVCNDNTNHNEVVQVVFDPAIVSYEQLLQIFWQGHDPTQGMRQGNDRGAQYRSGIYTADDEQMRLAQETKAVFQERLTEKGFGISTTEITPASAYHLAEDYHQQYLAKNPAGYCGIGGTGVTCPIGVA